MIQKTPQVFGTILVSPDRKILLVKGRKTGKWSFPKGHPEENEEELVCARRETYEETGIRVTPSFQDVLTLSVGRYFVYYLPSKVCPEVADRTEVCDAEWWSLDQLHRIERNCDVSYFLRYFTHVV